MNKNRRLRITDLCPQLQNILHTIAALRDEGQEYYDALSESAQDGENGRISDNAISDLEDAISSIEDAISALEQAAGDA
jgi:hypothetical protein